MKRLFSVILVVLITMSVAAQTIDYTNIQITEEKVHTKVVKKKYSFATFDYGFVGSRNRHNANLHDIREDSYGANVQAPGNFSHAIGFSVGQVRQWGWYTNIMFGTHMKIEEPGSAASHRAKPHNSCFSLVPGIMCRCGIPLYAFMGVGYGYQADNILVGYDEESFWGLSSDTRWLNKAMSSGIDYDPKNEIHTVAWQVGFMGIIKCVTIKAALNGIGPCVGAEFGIGYAYEHKN